MRFAIAQMKNTGSIRDNYYKISTFIKKAKQANCDVVVFPECALTGYPPIERTDLKSIDFKLLNQYEEELASLSQKHKIHTIYGTISKVSNLYYNSLKCIGLQGKLLAKYDKRSLWGYDLKYFEKGKDCSVIKIKSIRIGLAICFDIRFPEIYQDYFNNTDLIITIFCDNQAKYSKQRHRIIESHIISRAVENITPHIVVNSGTNQQNFPSAVYDENGIKLIEAELNVDQLLVYDYLKSELSYGSKGRRVVRTKLINMQREQRSNK